MKFPLNFQHQYTKCKLLWSLSEAAPMSEVSVSAPPVPPPAPSQVRWPDCACALAAYRLFGAQCRAVSSGVCVCVETPYITSDYCTATQQWQPQWIFLWFEHNSCKFCKFCKFLIGGNPKWQPTDTERDIETCCFLPVLGESYTDPRAAASDGNETRSDTKQQKSLKMLLNAEMVKLFWREW